jgi:hypothetical protein
MPVISTDVELSATEIAELHQDISEAPRHQPQVRGDAFWISG